MAKFVWVNLGVAFGYVVTGVLGLLMVTTPGSAPVLWPPTGLAIAAALRWGGLGVTPGIMAGAALVNAYGEAVPHFAAMPWVMAVGAAVQAQLAAAALRRFFPQQHDDTAGQILRVNLLIIAACTVATAIGHGVFLIQGWNAEGRFLDSFVRGWLADSLGALVFAPLCLALLRRDGAWLDPWQSAGNKCSNAEKALGATEEKYRAIADFTYEWETWTAPDGRYLYISPSCERVSGYGAEQFLKHSDGLFHIVVPEDRAKVKDHFERAECERLEQQSIEFRIRRYDGGVRWLEHVCRPVYSSDGRYLGQRAIFRDIHDRKVAYQALERYRQNLDNLVQQRTAELEASNRHLNATLFAMDTVGIGIHWAQAETGRFLYVNECACQMLGRSREEMLTLCVPDIDPLFPPGLFFERTAEVRQQGFCRFESLNRHKDGRDIPVEVIVRYQPGEAGGSNRFIAFVTDISARKQVEAELQQAKEAAEAANRAKSAFLANMSHELRTPLNAILGFAELMERDASLDEGVLRNLRIIDHSGRHLLGLINDVLDISRIEAGRSTIHRQVFDLHDLLETLTDSVSLRARKKGLELRFEKMPNLPRHVSTDLSKLRQVLLNLLSNAVKYTDAGQIGFRAAAEPTHSGTLLVFDIQDTGIGIATEDLERVFQPFFQTAAGLLLGEGTGLGLAICREYAQLLRGNLSAESSLGAGSRFRFAVPVDVADKPPETPIPPSRVMRLAVAQPTYRILVAEDNLANQHVIADLLRGVGFEVAIAANGQKAVEMAASWQPDFIWMDMRMPVMDGYEATRRIRALPGGATIPIVALTASAFEDDRPSILAAGCNDVVRKPIEAGRLFDLMAERLSVNFVYGERDSGSVTSEVEAWGGSALLPEVVRERLRLAVIALDVDAVQGVADEIRTDHPDIARFLVQHLENYQFDAITDWLGPQAQ